MIETVEGLKAVPISFSGGIDEISPSDSLEPGDAVKFTNWRLSKDGKRIQKRAGLYEEYTAFAEDVYGYSTYVNSSSEFCQIAVLESKVMRKVASGPWSSLFTLTPTAIDHVVKPLEISGKQFIITEKGSRVIQTDGNARQIGITAPTTLPTAVAAYDGTTPAILDDHMVGYATTGDMDAVWTDGDAGGGTSTLATTNPDSVPGPDADLRYMRLASGVAAGSTATRYRSVSGGAISGIFAIEMVTYFDALSDTYYNAGFKLKVDIGKYVLGIYIAKDGVWIKTRSDTYTHIIAESIPTNKHIKWNISVNASDVKDIKVDIFCTFDGLPKFSGTGVFYLNDSTTDGRITLEAQTSLVPTLQTDVYIDYITIRSDSVDSARISGLYRYAVSFFREGDFGCESNPIKSSIGTVAFSGSGLNDMTINEESEYTGPSSISMRVEVKTAASPQDTIRWSEDGGVTWSGEIKLATKVYLGHGITVNFGAITGHGATNYWTIPCNCCSAIATLQHITISSIPTSTDAQVTARKVYRTVANGAKFYYLTTIYDRNVTTEFVDNFADSTLGDEMEEDRDVFSEISTTIGKFSEYWDDRLWIADHSENVVYYSALRSGGGVPEEFDMLNRFIPVKRGVQGDVITAMKAYKDSLYVFKRNDIFIIQKNYAGYGVYHLNSDVGCISDGCVEQVNDMLIFPSERGIEIYDGVKPYSPEFSLAVNKTYLEATAANYKYWSIVHDKEFNEVWLAIPDSNLAIVWNYIRNKFYYFSFYKVPSCLVSCKDTNGKRVVKMGTRDGYLLLCDYGTVDHTTDITATYRKGWLDMQSHGIARLLKVDYELPASMTITCNVYVDMDKDVFRTYALTGVTPTATDIELRRVIGDKVELGVRARWMSVEFVNAQDCGGNCKINEAVIMVRPDVIKNKSYGD